MDWRQTLEYVSQLSGTSILTIFVTAAAGAFFGAWGAQAVISRGQRFGALVAELNAVNTAVTLSFIICNAYLGLKKQHVQPMSKRFCDLKQEHEKFLEAAKEHREPKLLEFQFQADWQTLSPQRTPNEALERILLDKVSIGGRGLSASAYLFGAIDSLIQSITYRNTLIVDLQKSGPHHPKALLDIYLGLSDANGTIDERFSTSIDAISAYTDDCVFFAKVLGEDLREHGVRLRRRNRWKTWKRLPKITRIDWSQAANDGLFPPDELYKDWLSGFKQDRSRRERLCSWVKCKLSGIFA